MGKKETIYDSSNEDLAKMFVLLITLSISIFFSLSDIVSFSATILVQSITNMYDFYKFTDNKIYVHRIKFQAILVVLFSVISLIVSIILMAGKIPDSVFVRGCVILLVATAIFFVYNDYRENIKIEG